MLQRKRRFRLKVDLCGSMEVTDKLFGRDFRGLMVIDPLKLERIQERVGNEEVEAESVNTPLKLLPERKKKDGAVSRRGSWVKVQFFKTWKMLQNVCVQKGMVNQRKGKKHQKQSS